MNREGVINLTQASNSSGHQKIFLLTLLGLLVLRIPFLGGIGLLGIQGKWIWPIFDIGTYLLTTFLIWWELDHLADYHIDTLAVTLIVLFKPIETLILRLWGFNDNPLAFPGVPSLVLWSIALVFAIGMWRKRSQLPVIKSSKSWFFIGMLAGLFTAVLLSFPMSYQIPKEELSYGLSVKEAARGMWIEMLIGFPYQLGYAAVTEEPLFRGFLWGYLRKLQWREVWIWLFQAGLFMFGHIYYITKLPISFWIIVPVGALVLGWLAWRSRTIASSMAVHAMMNATARAFGYLVAIWRLG